MITKVVASNIDAYVNVEAAIRLIFVKLENSVCLLMLILVTIRCRSISLLLLTFVLQL